MLTVDGDLNIIRKVVIVVLWMLIDQNTFFTSGGFNPREEPMNDCYTFNISTNTLERKKDMTEPRIYHGL